MKAQHSYPFVLIVLFLLLFNLNSHGQKRKRNTTSTTVTSALPDSVFKGLKFRNIGPAFMSGRIADVAIHPDNENIWYVAVGSGGVWKTTNSGTTWKPIFDKQNVYSIGCVTIDPNNPNIIWVGTGENIGGRHSGFGDGIYKSIDGGENWNNVGLPDSEHISKIIVQANNSNIIYVASQGPLWSKGGDRGFYKSIDGGKSWKKTLGNNEWTGVTDMVIDPENPDVIYAATWDRHRTVAAYMGGGPGSGLHKSTDGGDTWTKLTEGLPKSNMGKIGLAISFQNPDVIYAAIELDRRTGGVYRSMDRGASWEKRSDAVAGATGPHYYQELYASPHQEGRLYLVDNRMQMSEDGGKVFKRFNNAHKHSDNHSVSFRKNDPNYLLIGTDGGLYESFDLGANWRFIDNLPITQFYKVALDDAEPFYNIYGGTQDNSTQGGPSRTDNVHGIMNADWKVVLNWDGHQPATEPGNPNIMYGERQEGTLSRIDLITGEVIDIQPQPDADEDYERFNWDAPILVSPHSPTRIYFASQRVWKSDDRGDNWEAISGDLTRNQERIKLQIMGKQQSWDAPWDMLAMSNYNTITSLAESPQRAGLIYAGTDDGIIQVTENGGASWRKIEVGSIPGVPSTAFVNDIKADLFEENTVYVALDNHKYGDYKPYLVKSMDKGLTWSSIKSNLPSKTLVWRLVQDHVNKELLFCATEFGIYFTVNSGRSWTKLTGGIPTISFRDLAIQRRENDLVGASFGRGFFVLDDYSALRNITPGQLQSEAILFNARPAWWYIPRPILDFEDEKGSQGASHFTAPNPDFGAVFTYYLKDEFKSKKQLRSEKEKQVQASNRNITFPGWEEVERERTASKPEIIILIKDASDNIVRRVIGSNKAGIQRVSWDLRYPASEAIAKLHDAAATDDDEPMGMLAIPGTYSATLFKKIDGEVTQLGESIPFEVKALRESALNGASHEEVSAFWRSYEESAKKSSALSLEIQNSISRAKRLSIGLLRSQAAPGSLDARLQSVLDKLYQLDRDFNGNRSKLQVGEKTKPTIGERMFAVYRGISRSTYGPTSMHKKNLEIVNDQMNGFKSTLTQLEDEMNQLSKEISDANGPIVED